MSQSQLKVLLVFAVVIPLAIAIGYLSTQSEDPGNLLAVGLVFIVCCLPLLLKTHHFMMILSWNAGVQLAFLPGRPALWIAMTVASLFLSLLKRTVNRKTRFISVPFLNWPVLVLGLIILLTGFSRGGLGLQSLGSSMYGAKRYVLVIVAILGYFALSCQVIPRHRAILYASLFFLSGVSNAMADIIYAIGPSVYWLYYIFPADLATNQAMADITGAEMSRLEGVAWASLSFFSFMLVKYGVRGVLDLRRFWRLLLLLLVVGVGLYGGFRSRLFWVALFFSTQFCLEGLWRTRWLPILFGTVLLGLVIVLPNVKNFPLSIQRSLSFLPVKIDPVVAYDAEVSTQWRLDMWQQVRTEIPHYFWRGQGYAFSGLELEMLQEGYKRGTSKSYESFILTGEYHNGILSVLLPFGIFGLLAFVWLLIAGFWALLCNYRYGDPALRTVNTCLLAFFLVKAAFFTVSGALSVELAVFTGTLGLSISLNSGVMRRPSSVPTAAVSVSTPALA